MILKLNPLMCLYTTIHTCTDTNHTSCVLLPVYQRKKIWLLHEKKPNSTGDARMLTRTCWRQTQIIHYLLPKELHITNPPFTNHRTSALLNLVMLSHLTSRANWPRTVSTGKASCQRHNDKDAKKGCQCFHWVRKRN